jgi:hypothetical protein
MRKLIIVFLLMISLNSFSQKKKFDPDADRENFFRVGAKVGVNINKINGVSYNSGFNYNYLLGGFMQFNFSKRFGIQSEVNFVQSSSQFSKDGSDIYYDLFIGGTQKKAKLDYLKIPVLLNINIGPSKRVKLQVGPQIATALKQTVDSLMYNRTLYKKADWSAVGGIWIQIPFVNLGARYEIGLTNLNDIDNQQKWKSRAFTMFAGFTF